MCIVQYSCWDHKLNNFHYFGFMYALGQKYCAPQVRLNQGSNSWPPDHDSTFHVTETPALTTRPSVTSGIIWSCPEGIWHIFCRLCHFYSTVCILLGIPITAGLTWAAWREKFADLNQMLVTLPSTNMQRCLAILGFLESITLNVKGWLLASNQVHKWMLVDHSVRRLYFDSSTT